MVSYNKQTLDVENLLLYFKVLKMCYLKLARIWSDCAKKKRGRMSPVSKPLRGLNFVLSAEEPQHSLVGLRGQRQSCRGQRLTSLQGQHVGAFLVGVCQNQTISTGLQCIDAVLGEFLTDLHGVQVRTEG